jgi:alkaline phosphatase
MSFKVASLLILAVVFVLETRAHPRMHPKISRSAPSWHSQVTIPGDDQEPERWMKSAKETIDQVLVKKKNHGLAKNVILFLGDGMGMTTITAG